MRKELLKPQMYHSVKNEAASWPKAPIMAQGLVAAVTSATHFQMNTQTRTLCLLRLELSSQSDFLSEHLAEGRPESKVEHRSPRMKLKLNTHEQLLLLRSEDYSPTNSHLSLWSHLLWAEPECDSCEINT